MRGLSRRRLIKLGYLVITLLLTAIIVRAFPAKDPGSALSSSDALAVVEVFDGDTISVQRNGVVEKVRFIGIDTPETKDPRKPVQCFGKEASQYTKGLLEGKRVRLEIDSTQGERDRYDRILAYVRREDGLFVNQQLVAEGYAHEYTYQDQEYAYQAEFRAAEEVARNEQKGLWSPNTCNGDTSS
ncbi:MAG: micrococcal nuclease [Patescibacteria group bacterium]|nr:micrococcal nuclease [Patescibacteria group bacterium]